MAAGSSSQAGSVASELVLATVEQTLFEARSRDAEKDGASVVGRLVEPRRDGGDQSWFEYGIALRATKPSPLGALPYNAF